MLRVLLTLFFSTLPLMAEASAADRVEEYELKAAYLFNFAKFTEWPNNARSGPLQVCIVGRAPFGETLDKMQNKTLGGRALLVRRNPTESELGQCHILFVCASENERATTLLHALRNRPVLTVGESEASLQDGMAINLSLEGERLTFEINLEALRRAQINLSSKVLRLARRVYTEQP